MTIHNAPLGAGGVGCLYVIFFLCIEEEVMSLSVFYYCTCIYVLFYVSHCCYLSFNPFLFCLSPFLLSYVAVSRPCGLWEFYCNRPHSGSKFVYHNVQAHIPPFPHIFALSPYFSISYLLFAGQEIKLFTRLMDFCYFKGTIALERKTSIRVQAKWWV